MANTKLVQREQTTMRLRPDLLAALDLYALDRSAELGVPVSRSRIVENMLIQGMNDVGYQLPAEPAREIGLAPMKRAPFQRKPTTRSKKRKPVKKGRA